MRLVLLLALAGAAVPPHPGPTIASVAGTGIAGYSGDQGIATDGQLNDPLGITVGPDAALYICDTDNHVVRRFDLRTHQLSTVAGNARQGYSGDGGPAVDASLNQPYEVRFDPLGNMYVVDMLNHVVRRVDAHTRQISTFAGTGSAGFGGDGGPATRAQLRMPLAIAFDLLGRLLICDTGNQRVRRVDLRTGVIETMAGTGERKPTPDGAALENAPLNGPRDIEVDRLGNLFLLLRDANQILRLDAKTNRFSYVAGSGRPGYAGDGGPAVQALLNAPKAIALHDTTLLIADTENHAIRKVDLLTGIITTLIGTGERGDGPDGDPLHCRLARPHGVALGMHGAVWVADSENHRIREMREPHPLPMQILGPPPHRAPPPPVSQPGQQTAPDPPPSGVTPRFHKGTSSHPPVTKVI